MSVQPEGESGMGEKRGSIGLEKENIFRIAADGILLALALFLMLAIFLAHGSAALIAVSAIFALLFALAIAAELYERVFYDGEHFEARTLAGTEKIFYADIAKIERVFVREKTVRGGGHWRYFVHFRTEGGILKKTAVPFPQSIHNEKLQDLFGKIKSANAEIQWELHAN